MSKFRLLVEELQEQAKNNSFDKYKLLNPVFIERLDKEIAQIEIDPSELDSAVYDHNPFDVEPQLIGSSGQWMYDDDEYYNAQINVLIDMLKEDGAVQYLWDLVPEEMQEDEEYDTLLTNEAIDYLESQKSDQWN